MLLESNVSECLLLLHDILQIFLRSFYFLLHLFNQLTPHFVDLLRLFRKYIFYLRVLRFQIVNFVSFYDQGLLDMFQFGAVIDRLLFNGLLHLQHFLLQGVGLPIQKPLHFFEALVSECGEIFIYFLYSNRFGHIGLNGLLYDWRLFYRSLNWYFRRLLGRFNALRLLIVLILLLLCCLLGLSQFLYVQLSRRLRFLDFRLRFFLFGWKLYFANLNLGSFNRKAFHFFDFVFQLRFILFQPIFKHLILHPEPFKLITVFLNRTR